MGRPPTCVCSQCELCRQREAQRRWEARNPGVSAARARDRRDQTREYERNRYQNDPVFREKKKARNMVLIRIARGTLERQPCEVCGEGEAQAHHDDYTRPLDVRWLCDTHHRLHHGEMLTNRIAVLAAEEA